MNEGLRWVGLQLTATSVTKQSVSTSTRNQSSSVLFLPRSNQGLSLTPSPLWSTKNQNRWLFSTSSCCWTTTRMDLFPVPGSILGLLLRMSSGCWHLCCLKWRRWGWSWTSRNSQLPLRGCIRYHSTYLDLQYRLEEYNPEIFEGKIPALPIISFLQRMSTLTKPNLNEQSLKIARELCSEDTDIYEASLMKLREKEGKLNRLRA